MDLKNYEESHKSNIRKLVQVFGKDIEDEINMVYDEQKIILETQANIKIYIPIITYRNVKSLLDEKYRIN